MNTFTFSQLWDSFHHVSLQFVKPDTNYVFFNIWNQTGEFFPFFENFQIFDQLPFALPTRPLLVLPPIEALEVRNSLYFVLQYLSMEAKTALFRTYRRPTRVPWSFFNNLILKLILMAFDEYQNRFGEKHPQASSDIPVHDDPITGLISTFYKTISYKWQKLQFRCSIRYLETKR